MDAMRPALPFERREDMSRLYTAAASRQLTGLTTLPTILSVPSLCPHCRALVAQLEGELCVERVERCEERNRKERLEMELKQEREDCAKATRHLQDEYERAFHMHQSTAQEVMHSPRARTASPLPYCLATTAPMGSALCCGVDLKAAINTRLAGPLLSSTPSAPLCPS